MSMDNTELPELKTPGERRSFSSEFKKDAVARLKLTSNASALAVELGVRRNQLYKWEKQADVVSGGGSCVRQDVRPEPMKVRWTACAAKSVDLRRRTPS